MSRLPFPLSLNNSDRRNFSQVDSHETLANGVVVQVSGELSNNGEPMRRFMQTFVLAPQSPKKYYVHNDIFRYQDEVFNDGEEVGGTCNTVTDTETLESSKDIMQSMPAHPESPVKPVIETGMKPEPVSFKNSTVDNLFLLFRPRRQSRAWPQ